MTHELVTPALRARLRDLRLVPRRAAGAQGLGQHSSRSRGVGLEFAQYRAYAPGDEPRRVDWKLYARSDRYFVRESERDSPLDLWVLVDASASMAQSDAANAALTATLPASTDGLPLALVAADSGPRQRDRCVQELLRWQAEGRWPVADQLLPLWERIAPASLVLLLTDAHDDAAIALAERLAAARREVVMIRVLTAEERDFPFRDNRRFMDVENGTEILADGPGARAAYLDAFAQAHAALASRLAASGIRLAVHYLDESPDRALRQLFGARPGSEPA